METSANTVSGAQTSTQERILSALKQARTKLEVITRQQNEPIAIIGMACRLPGGANDPESFWQLLDHGVDAVTEVPSTRWPIDTFYDSVPGTPGKMNTRWSGFLEEVDQFDARFFGISSREAIHIDPQQRLLMEICWEALEHAALAPYTLSGSRTGVFVGICSNDYARLQVNSPTSTNAYSGTSNAKGIAANRLSYLLDFRGPSIAVDTACSSSLVAVHQACQSLRQQECDLALSGGVNLILSPDVTIAFSQAGMMASDGRCKTFDTRADGYVRGEGAGMVVLKRLSDALCDDDPILALIRGSAVNQDGRSNGLTAPNGPAQRAVILEVLKNAQVEPSQIGYVEAHGTGTALGDPIEVNALKQIINQGTTHQEQAACEPCWIGSVKTNIGHLESAAGIASLIKVVLSLQAGKIPPHLHFSELNLRISLADSPLAIPTQGQPWPAERRMAGISSFGFGGTNAHIILGEAPKGAETSESVEVLQVANDSEFAETSSEMERPLHLLTLSAKDHNALCQLAKKYATRLRAKSDGTLADICFTANTGRTHFSHRLAAVDSTTEQLAEQLASFTAGEKTVNLIPGQNRASERPSVIFLFTGQGSQYVDMGRELYETQPTFRQTLDRCNEILEPYLDHSLLFVMFSSDQTAEDHPTTLSQTAYSQPALEYALAQLWLSWEIVPAAVLGHSVGEYVAACIAGAFSLEDGLKLIATRGRLMQTLPSDGAMAAVFANKAEVNAAIQPYVHDVTIAAINGPRNIVISGRRQAMPDIVADLTAKGIESRALRVSHAFHSPLMEPMLDAFEETAHTVSMHPLRIPLVSNLIGKMLPVGEQLDAKYWRQHIREPVRFATGIQTLLTQEQASIFLEIGPKPILSGLGKQSETEKTATWLPSLKQGKDDWEMMLRSLGTLYVQGVNIDWKAFDQEYKRRRLALPTYPFQRKRYWIFDESTSMNMTEQTSVSAGSVQAEEAASSLHREQILSSLRSLVAELLHESASDVNIHTPFIEMGADSIVMLDAIRRVESTYSVKIAIRQLFEDISTIDALATYVAEATEPESTMAQAVQIDAHTSAAINDIQHAVKHASSIQRATQTPSHLPASFQESIDPSEHVPQIEFGERATSDPMIERVIMRQIDFMAHQLDLLRGNGSATAKHADPNDKRSENGAVKNGHPGEGVAPNSASPILNGDIKDSATGIAQVSTGKQPTENGRAPQQEKQSSAAPVLPFAPTQAAEMWAKGLTSHQQQHLSTLIERYTKRTAKSKAMTQQYRPVLADNRASAGFRFSIKEMLYPIIGERSQDGRVWDVDGNEYVDLSMGFGVNLFGHQPDFVRQAIDAQLQKGLQLGVQSDLAGQVATLVSELTGMDRITFLNSGTEAVMTALRLARTATGRNKIAVFSGAYHGHFDGTSATINPAATEPNGDGPQAVPFAPGITPNMVADVVVIDGYGDPASLDVIRANSDDLAAVLVSPVQSRHPDLQPTEFLHQLRAITREAGIALIFDEMITGFRIHPGGAQAWFGVQADMATYGKIVGGGMPIGAMWHYGDDSYPSAETTFFAGTFCKHPLAMAAAQAVLTHIKSQGPALYEQLNGRTAQFAATLNAYFDQMQVPIHIDHFGPLFRFAFSGNMDLLFYHLLDKGVYIWEGRTCFLSTAHTDADLEHVMQAVKESVQEMQAGGFLPTKEKTEKQSQKHVASQNNLARSQPETTIEAPLSEAQQQLWFLAEIGDDGSMAYNESVCLQLNGELDVAAFRRTIQTLAARHEALRTTISTDGKCQYIHPNLEIELSLIDGSQEDMWQSELTTDQGQEPFDLTVGPLFRAHLIRLAPQRHLLVLMAHHIIVDGWSMGVIVQEMSQLYSAYSQGESIDLYPPMPFRTYVQWLTEQCQTTEMAEHEAYWLGQLSNSTPVLDLPLDHPRPPVKTYAGQRHTIRLDAELTNNIKSLSKSHGCTLFMTLFAAYTTFLHRITGQDDIVVGIPAAGRSMEGSQGLVGYCAHLLPIRTIADEGSPFSDYLTKMRSTLFEAFEHQDYPFARLLSRLKFERDASLSPVIATTFNLDRPVDVPKLLGIEADLTALPMSFVDHEISLNITEIDGAFAVDFDYNSDLFETTTIERLARHFESLLAGIVANPEQSISKLPLLTEAEQHQLLVEWNATQVDYPYDCTLQQLFEAQVEQTPNAIAVQFSESQNGQYANGQLPSTLTYTALNACANHLAHQLIAQGIGPDTVVAILTERSPEFLVAMLAVFKAGGAYLPLDARYPTARLAQVLAQSETPLVLTTNEFEPMLVEAIETQTFQTPPRLMAIDGITVQTDQNSQNPPVRSQATDLAYVIYTSGSTGLPKGAMVEQRGMVNHLYAKIDDLQLTADDVVAQTAPQSFDISVWQFLSALLVGGRIHIFPDEIAADPARLLTQTEDQPITILEVVPSLLHMMLEEADKGTLPDLAKLRWLIPTGEALPPHLCRQWFAHYPKIPMLNAYGPTECSDDVTHFPIFDAPAHDIANISIGRPVANMQMYILDKQMKPVPIGVAGELCVGGIGVGRGYLHDPGRTVQAFVQNPFTSSPESKVQSPKSSANERDSGPWTQDLGRLYKTGDKARYLPDGNIEFLGRLDHQVKIRGLRIELGDIEAALTEHPAVHQATVIDRVDGADQKRLAAYFVTNSKMTDENMTNGNGRVIQSSPIQRIGRHPITPSDLRHFLNEKLPDYMIPAAYVPLDALPLTPNGKIDRKALPEPESFNSGSAENFVAPRTSTEKKLVGIWAEVLKLDQAQVGIQHDFFELGGHSLLATQAAARIRQEFKIELPLRAYFNEPTIADLAEYIEATRWASQDIDSLPETLGDDEEEGEL